MGRTDNDDTFTVAALGGGALLAFLLLRRGWGFGGGGGGAPPAASAIAAAPPGQPCKVRVDGGGITVNGAGVDAPAVGRSCELAGSAEVTITGDAVHNVAAAAIRELKRARVPITRKGGIDIGDLLERTAP